MKKKLTQKDRRRLKASFSPFARLFRIQHHFFPNLAKWFNNMKDPRHPSYITYRQAVLIMELIMKCNASIKTMRGMTREFNTDTGIRNLGILSEEYDLEDKPDWQTINDYLEELEVCELEEIRYEMIRKLIRTKSYSSFTMNGSYPVIIDGTDIAYFRKKHCEHDLVKKTIDKETGETSYQYYHKALEAKIHLGAGLLLSIATEFIENEKEDVSKQDCELNAGYRLLDKLKEAFPRMKFIIVGDALFCTMPFMKAVRQKGWNYIFRIKEGRQSHLTDDFEDLLTQLECDEIIKNAFDGENGELRYVNHVEEVTNKPEICNMLQYSYRLNNKETKFTWATGMEISRSNAVETARTGRDRWKIENEGFNCQKNGIYDLEHHCSLDWNAMKNHYLVIQIAHILMQLYMAYDDVVYELGEGIKHTSSDLFVAFISKPLTEEEQVFVNARTSLHMRCLLIS